LEQVTMKRFVSFLSFLVFVSYAYAASAATTVNSTKIEEAFVDALGTCGPSSVAAGILGKTNDPGVRHALRDAVIVEAADDAAGLGGGAKEHSDCMQKQLKSRGISPAEMAVMPDCVEHDWPEPLDSLGQCVQSRARLESGINAH